MNKKTKNSSQDFSPTICRLCPAHCGVLVRVENGRLAEVRGDPDNPLYKGYSCAKGRALPDIHNNPNRLLHSQQRQTDGSYRDIGVEKAMDEISATLQQLVNDYGPRSVAVYTGTSGAPYPASAGMGSAFLKAIDSPMFFTPNTIDQPGKQIASAAHGHWLAGDVSFEHSDSWMLVGLNPVISKSVGVPWQNPAQKLKDAVSRGMQLVVIDPRKTETAKRATLHIQPLPGEDPTILAGIIHVVIRDSLYDDAFIEQHVDGFDLLARQVAAFTPDAVAQRAGIRAIQIVDAARLFAVQNGRGGMVHAGTGPNFAMQGNLTEYLALCLTTLCGHWPKAGQSVHRPNTLLPAFTARAQAHAPYPGWGFGEQLRIRGLGDAVCGLPTAALPDEILLEGDGKVRALICIGANPMAAWPDQRKTQRAMEHLDLLVTLDVEMSLTSRLADYVIATRMTLETPGMTQRTEALKYYTGGIGFSEPYAQVSPRIVDPPAHADLVEEWQFFHGLAKRMGLELCMSIHYGFGRYTEAPAEKIVLGPDDNTTTEELYKKICTSSRIPYDEVCQHPHGKIFDVDAVVEDSEPDWSEKLDIGNDDMMRALAQLASSDKDSEAGLAEFPFRLISRRANNFVNSAGVQLQKLNRAKPCNACFMHPDDLHDMQLKSGDTITIRSPHDSIPSIVEADNTLKNKVVALYHGFGGLVEEDHRFKELGSNIGRLIPNDIDYDPVTGIPRMSNIPVAIVPGWSDERH